MHWFVPSFSRIEYTLMANDHVTDITFHSTTHDPSILSVYLSSVPASNLSTIDATFKASLARIAKEGLDMKRMKMIIERQRLQLLESIEKDAVEVLSQSILTGELPFLSSFQFII